MTSRKTRDSDQGPLQLVRRAQAGELEAFDRLFQIYYDRVLAIVRRRMGRALRLGMDSHDLLQEAMVQAIRSFDQFQARSEPALLAWFARIVENRIRNTVEHQHALRRDRNNEVVLDHLRTSSATHTRGLEPADARTLPFDNLARKERASIVSACLEELDEPRRRVVLLRNQQRLTWEQIAAELGSSTPQAARMLYSRALVELKEKVARRLGEPEQGG